MNKRFYMIVRNEHGNVIFNHKSDKVKRLLALYNGDIDNPVFVNGVTVVEA